MHVRDGGTWKEVTAPSVRDGGVWKDVQEGWVRDGGTWKQFFNALAIVLTNRSVVSAGSGTSKSEIEFNSSGQLTEIRNGSNTNVSGEWMDPVGGTSGSNYDVRVTATGDPVGGPTLGSWWTLGVTNKWSVTSNSGFKTATLSVDIRDASTLSIVASATITLDANAF